MKRLTPAILALLGLTATGWPSTPAQLTSLEAVYQIDNGAANRTIPVTLAATVTYFRPFEQTMFVQDGALAIFVEADTETKLLPGDRVLVHGVTRSGLRPYIFSSEIVLLHHGSPPPPRTATFDELIAARYDCMRVILRGRVRTADEEVKTDVRGGGRPPQPTERLQLLTDGGVIEAEIDLHDGRRLEDVLDAEVEIAGVAGGKLDGKMEQTGVVIHVPSLDDVKVLKRVQGSSWSLPVTAMDQVLHTAKVLDLTARVRVHGTVTYYEPGSTVVLQDGSKSLWISTLTRNELAVGEVADAIGFPDAHNGFLRLNDAELQGRGMQVPIVPERVGWGELARSGRIFDLVSIDGQVVTENRETAQDEYVIASEGHLFTAIFRHDTIRHFMDESIPPMTQMPIGSRVRVTGICIPQDSNPFNGNVPFDLLLRSHDDIVMLVRPSLWNVRNLTLLAGVLLLAVFGVVARGWSLEHRMRRETALAATVEQWRSRVLEDINRARPLPEIMAQITALLSYKLQGAPCWWQTADGTKLGECPEEQAGRHLLIIRRDIPSHSGEALGAIYAGIDPHSKFRAAGPEALSNAAQLAALAIETGGLYSDLVHRSEFDPLTDIHNRFSLEKRLDVLIEGERLQDETFGLIYIDLDDFKQVNDLHGHGVGDLYLQQAALRMKRQMRPEDMLARLGGDEFAVVVPAVRNRADVEEITRRLGECFDEVFVLDRCRIRCSASIGMAVYPQDGTTRNALLSAADAGMYEAKRRRHETEKALAGDES